MIPFLFFRPALEGREFSILLSFPLLPALTRRLNPDPPLHLDPLPICLHSMQPTSLQKVLQGLSMKQGTLTWAKQPAPDRCRPEARREKAGA